jgi:hypothetical protein
LEVTCHSQRGGRSRITDTSSMRELNFSISPICAPGRPFASPHYCRRPVANYCYGPISAWGWGSSRVLLGFSTRSNHEYVIAQLSQVGRHHKFGVARLDRTMTIKQLN